MVGFLEKRKEIKRAKRQELFAMTEEFLDIHLDNVREVVRHKERAFIVFIDADIEIDWKTTTRFDEEKHGEEFAEQQSAILQRLNTIQYTPAVKYLSKKKQTELMSLLGESLALFLSGSFTQAQTMLDTAQAFLDKRMKEMFRFWQLAFSFALAGVAFVVLHRWIPEQWALFYSCAGALFSIIATTGNANYDCEAGRYLIFLEILARFAMAVISGVIARQLFDLELLFTAFKKSADPDAVANLVCFIAGFSERLVPSIVSKFGEEESKT